MSGSRDQRDRTWTYGQRDSTLRSHRLAQQRDVKLDNPSAEELRECIRDQWCWWCGKGGWRVLAGHTSRAHGITAMELRDMARLFKHDSICDEDHSDRCRMNPQALHPPPTFRPRYNGGRQYSTAGLESQRQRLDAVRSPQQAREASLRSAEIHRRPHPCPVCGTIVPQAHPKTCSPECRRVIRRLTAYLSNTGRRLPSESRRKQSESMRTRYAEGKGYYPIPRRPHPCPICGTIVPTATPLACSPECRHILLQRAQRKATESRVVKVPRTEYAVIAARRQQGDSTALIARDYQVSPRFIRAICANRDVLRGEP